jgi:hypothetical protein
MGLLGLITWSAAASLTAGGVAKLVLTRALSGLAVAFIEETFIRGAMLTGIARESGVTAAVLLTSLIYAATHFFASYKIPAADVTAASGLDLISGTLHLFAHPMAIADAFSCLFAVGVVLAIIRVITGNIAAGIGLHAGWVWVMLVAHELSQPVRDADFEFPAQPLRRLHRLAGAGVDSRLRLRLKSLLRTAYPRQAHASAAAPRPLRERRQQLQALNRVVHFQIGLLLRQRNRQNFRQSMSHPRRVVQAHVDVGVHLAQLRQHVAKQVGQPRMARRNRHHGLHGQPFHLAHIEAIRLHAALHNPKAPLAHARQPQQPIRQLIEIRDARQSPHLEGLRRPHFPPSRISTTPKFKSPRMHRRTMST